MRRRVLVLLGVGALLLAWRWIDTAPVQPETTAERRIEDRLRQAVADWSGTPHRSMDASGLDCSSFVLIVYRDLFEIDLPRSSRGQVRVGEAVARDALEPGDLVFFADRRGRIDHSGFYVGRGEFGHVSSSRGVMLSRMDEAYWAPRFHAARRLPLE